MLPDMLSLIPPTIHRAILGEFAEHVSNGVLLIELPQRHIHYCNPSAEKIAASLTPTAPNEACTWLLAQIPENAFHDAEASGVWTGCLSMAGARGNATLEVTLRSAAMPELADFTPVLVELRDIGEDFARTRERQERHVELTVAYERLATVQQTMLQNEKMAATGRLAAGVAHEINNPIGYVHSNLGTLQEYVGNMLKLIGAYDQALRAGPAPDAAREIDQLRAGYDIDYAIEDLPQLLRESLDGIARVRKIVQDLKDFSHPAQDEKWSETDLHKCIDSTLNIVSSEIKYKGRVEKQYGDIPPVEGLASELGQVFMNMLINAAQAMPDQGVITIATGTQGDEAWVSISDNGEGIQSKNLPHIFEPFFTTKPVGLGTGLGLSISYGIINKHHGRIEVFTAPGQGTTFRIVLPIRQPASGISA